MAKTALIIGGGAPNATLMSGALTAFDEAGVEFDVVSTAGAGALIGLLYLAPASGDVQAALRSTVEMGVSDAIYERYPVNYKVFQKPGAVADLYRSLVQANPFLQTIQKSAGTGAADKLVADLAQLMFASFCPTTLDGKSLGLCAAVPFLEHIVDFAALDAHRARFYVNAYNIDDRYMQNFSSARGEINADTIRAALAFPFLYPPYRMKDPKSKTGEEKFYYEGAAHDCLNYKSLVENERSVRDIVVFDVLGAEKLMRKPRDLYDAWLLSIIVPLIEIARDDTKIFQERHNRAGKWNLLPVKFDIAAKDWETSLDWSRSNLARLFDVGYRSAQRFLADEGAALPRRGKAETAAPVPTPARRRKSTRMRNADLVVPLADDSSSDAA
ncbi:patatin-like phospholipase family protein [Azoarcus sp. KH32C]|uniref:patatin-like phospholipase family protein n=1 Tax=Azoarcus sp. KH32C TaxID=748247 RepID=UPI00023869CB|nr:patatin-like phospholipase family protein [Azoarcus sp. KH32C]BAL26483.1 hypothetical protein AZKH_4204 [Azoarcus sp. KH32C]